MKFILKIRSILLRILRSPLFWIFTGAFLLRVTLTSVDLPFVFHPDEPTVVNSTQNLKYSLNPKHFDWPNLYYYLNYPLYFILERTHYLLIDLRLESLAKQVVDISTYYTVTRIFTVFFGAMTCVFVALIVLNLTNNRPVSYFSGTVMALIPFHITRSSQALTDVPMLFFLTLSVYFLTRNFCCEKKWNYYFSFFFAGLAISTKYNAYLIFPTLILSLLWIRKFNIKDWFFYFKCGILTPIGFFLGTPYALLDWKTFIRDDSYVGMLWQFKNVGKVEFFEQVKFFFSNLLFNVSEDFGFLPYYASLIFIAYFVLNTRLKFNSNVDKFKFILILQFIYFIWVVSGLRIQRTHYFITLYFIPPIFSAFIIERYKALPNIFLILTSIFSFWTIFINYFPSPQLQLYNRLDNSKINEEYLFFTDSKDTLKVLKKLDVQNKKLSTFNNIEFKGKYNYVITEVELCISMDICRFHKVDNLQHPSGRRLNIYEVK
jgi:4-amino-4-deoxy-L-arabinose transferase-like glycosyltransferase